MPSTRETRDSILLHIARTEWTPCELAFWRTPAGIERFKSYMPDSDSSSTASSATLSDDDEEIPRPHPSGAQRMTPASLASAASQSLGASRAAHRQTRDAHLQSKASVSADVATSLASPFAQPVSSSDMQNQGVLQYSQRILGDEIQRDRTRTPFRGPNGRRTKAGARTMDAVHLEYEESATRSGVVRLPRQTAADLHVEAAEFRRQHTQVQAPEMAAAAVRVPAPGLRLPGSGSNRGEIEEDEEAG